MTSHEKNAYSTLEATAAPCSDFLDNTSQETLLNLATVEKEIDVTLKVLRESTDPDQQQALKEQLVVPATELAALILPHDVCRELNIHPSILDNQSFYHPPTGDDVLRLAESAEVTEDPTVTSAFIRSIDELPLEARQAFERALEAKNNNLYTTFSEALFYTKLDNKDFDSNDFNIAYANTFFDHGTLEPDVNYNELERDDPLLERLVSPIATSMRGQFGTRTEPKVEFFYQADRKGAVKKLGQTTIDRLMNIA
jgi:hypothetical protein